MSKPKIIIWDVETTPIQVYTWRLANSGYHSPDNIVSDWSLICGAWKELGDEKVQAIAIKTVGDDYEVVKTIRDVLATADIIVHHNGDSFDIKMLNARIIFHGLQPLPPIHMVDTKKQARKIAAFSSNKLDYLAKHLLGRGKVQVDYQLWLDVMKGSKKALKAMVDYNKVDVEVLEGVYNALKPYMKSHPHVGVYEGNDKNCSCGKCGNTTFKKNGLRYTAAGLVKQELQCKKCRAYMRVPFKSE